MFKMTESLNVEEFIEHQIYKCYNFDHYLYDDFINDVSIKMELQISPDKTNLIFICEVDCDLFTHCPTMASLKVFIDSINNDIIFKKLKQNEWTLYNSVFEYTETLSYSNLENLMNNKFDNKFDNKLNFNNAINTTIQELIQNIPDDILIKSASKLF
jgi:hypothetical protein